MPVELRASLARTIERLCLVLGVVCLAWCGVVFAQAAFYQSEASAALDRVRGDEGRPVTTDSKIRDGQMIGRLEIPRLHVSVMVAEGDREPTLKVAVGHLPETALPWQVGNTTLAGHRDTFFRPLRDIRVQDQLRIATAHGTFLYEVTNVRVVDPQDVSVLAATDQPMLTLVTCYPFWYVGSAPQRFVVQAKAVSTGAVRSGRPHGSTPARAATQSKRAKKAKKS